MNRTLTIDVKYGTWPGPKKVPAFPPLFHKGAKPFDLNVPSMLLMIGYLTTPTSSTGVSLSEFWAWVRYLAAVSLDADLRLTQSFSDLDAHQKTILSDDFGMGVPMLWLNDKLALSRLVDGRYFMKRIAASLGATQRRTAKRGPNKTPDFVARDTDGLWHVVECKGTQSGRDYCAAQLGDPGPPPTGGVAQKNAITFPSGHTGQRLVCGLSIGVENGDSSRLTVIDPEPEEPFVIKPDQLGYADDAATRGVVSKALRLAGFETTAEATAAPLGRTPSATRYASRRAEDRRQRDVDEREIRAKAELDRGLARAPIFDGRFRGREVLITLPRPILVDEREIVRVFVRQGVNTELLGQLRERPTIDEPNFDAAFDWADEIGRQSVEGSDLAAVMSIGNIFRSEIALD